MADITVPNGTRPKATTVNSLPVPLLIPAASHDDTADRSVSYISYENLAPSPATIAISQNVNTTSGTAIVTITGATFTYSGVAGTYDVRVGDAVDGTGIGDSARVLSVNSPTQLTLSVNSTATGVATDIVITPPTYDVNLLAIVKDFTQTASTLSVRVRVFRSDGTSNIDSDGDGVDESTFATYGAALIDKRIDINLDTLLANQRSARSA